MCVPAIVVGVYSSIAGNMDQFYTVLRTETSGNLIVWKRENAAVLEGTVMWWVEKTNLMW